MDKFRAPDRKGARLEVMQTPPSVPGYRVGELIARGSTATVWAACPAATDRDLAVKVVPLPHGEDDGGRIALELSALAAAGGRDDHLVTVVDVLALTDPRPAVAIVMERLRHGTLARLVSTRGHLTPGEVVTVLTPVALTVARLHDGAVVHGDIAPSNVGFDSRGRPVVLDLGVSAVVGTPREEIYGTPGFVAPEVVAGGQPTPSSDVYGIGALGWHALTGEPPPIPADRPPLDELAPDVPDRMRRALERALHPDPEQRGDGRELATAIYGSAAAVPVTPGEGSDEATMLTHRVRELARAAGPDPTADSRRGRRARHAADGAPLARSRARVVSALVAAVVIGAAGIALGATGRGAGPAPVAPAPGRVEPAPAERADGAVDGAVEGSPEGQTRTDYTAVVEGLVEARARAWTSRDPATLTSSFMPDSAVLEGDLARLAAAEQAGARYEGLRFDVADVRVLAESQDHVRVEATITTSSYAVRTEAGDGAGVERRDGTTERLRLDIVRVDGGWRIGEVGPVPG